MARRGGRGRRGGRRRSTRRSNRTSRRSTSRRRSTAASKRRRVRSVAKAKRARNTTKSTSSKSKSTGGSKGRSNNTRGGQAKANRNQNKKARRTVRSVKKAVSKVAKNVGKAVGKATRGAASYAANHPGVSSYNRKTRDMSKLSPQSRRRYERLSAKTGRDYSKRIPSMKINLSADRLAQFGGFADSGWYKGITSRFPGIKKLQINKQLYSNPMKKGWHSSQRTGRGQGLTPEAATRQQLAGLREHPSQNISRMYDNLLGRKADQEGLDYWTNEFLSGKTNMEGIRKSILASQEFKGRSDADRSAVLSGLKQNLPARGLADQSVLREIMMKRKTEGKPAPDVDKTEGWLDFYKPENQKKINKGLPPDFTPMPSPDISLDDFTRGAYKKTDAPLRQQEDWLGSFYKDFNIGGAGGKLDDEARNYWSGEAKKHGRGKVLDTIRATAKKQGTWGGRSRSNKKRRSGGPNKLMNPKGLHGIPR